MIFSIFDKDNNIIGRRELKGSYELSAWSNTVKLFEIQKMTISDNMNIFDFIYFSDARNISVSEDSNYDLRISNNLLNMRMYSKGTYCSKLIIKNNKTYTIRINEISLADFICEKSVKTIDNIKYVTIEFNNKANEIKQIENSNEPKLKIKKLFGINNEEEVIDIVNEDYSIIIVKILRILDKLYLYNYRTGKGDSVYYNYDLYNNCIAFTFVKNKLNSIVITFNENTDKFLDCVNITNDIGEYECIKNIYYLLKMTGSNKGCNLSDNVSASISDNELIINILGDNKK